MCCTSREPCCGGVQLQQTPRRSETLERGHGWANHCTDSPTRGLYLRAKAQFLLLFPSVGLSSHSVFFSSCSVPCCFPFLILHSCSPSTSFRCFSCYLFPDGPFTSFLILPPSIFIFLLFLLHLLRQTFFPACMPEEGIRSIIDGCESPWAC